jgi:hypothetical protein
MAMDVRVAGAVARRALVLGGNDASHGEGSEQGAGQHHAQAWERRVDRHV